MWKIRKVGEQHFFFEHFPFCRLSTRRFWVCVLFVSIPPELAFPRTLDKIGDPSHCHTSVGETRFQIRRFDYLVLYGYTTVSGVKIALRPEKEPATGQRHLSPSVY
ncbi:hypothetical protein HRR83_005175 [Exophiala dermatitidis]|uniref:Uncharacterized protein n=1 Tax=Exophiala dermatitidis TaxID=5970 RepID=A0AAN6IYE5_EXODE|nr:hypothetical protein HRR74_005027 [Exophiala dermatitidis]KAJ4518723.1 hypothetical protein HRR73_004304 [Exophiala dermatitidis]KAJ4534238.1 hypothetical protein HRR76_006170 [Exophiala dermatitidis]KAJ4550392.1 hypothetical protein HRR77_003857 [Exophiala dermatitidis]KAJ4563519.1 hypothetical protein HRR79_006397 [Exophiala dermatitidis]